LTKRKGFEYDPGYVTVHRPRLAQNQLGRVEGQERKEMPRLSDCNPSAAVARLNPEIFGGAPTVAKSAPVEGKRIRQESKPLMNKLELEAWEVLSEMRNNSFIPQAIRFRLGNGIWYKPDFFSFFFSTGPHAVEVKGPHAFRGGFENLKVAAHEYPMVTWWLMWKEDGEWKRQEIKP
jgi:hypothetical protein